MLATIGRGNRINSVLNAVAHFSLRRTAAYGGQAESKPRRCSLGLKCISNRQPPATGGSGGLRQLKNQGPGSNLQGVTAVRVRVVSAARIMTLNGPAQSRSNARWHSRFSASLRRGLKK